jgi:phosphotransferase system HPr (HPr) family protein
MITATPVPPSRSAKSEPAEPEVKRTFIVQHLNGIHARPAALLASTLQNYRCRVLAECGGCSANPRSIFGLLTLAAGCGSKMTFTATGKDAVAALNEVEQLFKSNFKPRE